MERKKKQEYLVKEIIEKGYDPAEFTNFIANEREGGHDVEVWTLPDLKEVVEKFKENLRNRKDQLDLENQFDVEVGDAG